MFSLNGSRARLLGVIAKVSAADPSRLRCEAVGYYQQLERLHSQHIRPRIFRILLVILFLIWCPYFWSALSPSKHSQSQSPFPSADIDILNFNSTNRLPLIPPKIWQIYLSYVPGALTPHMVYMNSWIAASPSQAYTVLDGQGALAIVSKLSHQPTRAHILPVFYAMSRRVLRADFLRYLLLAIEGGVYSDIDTQLIQPIHDWVPDEFKNRTKLIVGLEADSSPPVSGTTYEIQFCQWTLAGAAGHPVLWTMVDRIVENIKNRPFQDPPKDIDYSDGEVLDITGPAGWTEVVFQYLNTVLESPITWRNLTGMTEPRLYGDVLILPINGFATGVPHSGASLQVTNGTMIKHQFSGAWRDGGG